MGRDNIISARYTATKDAVKIVLRSGRAAFIWGPPGIGKSDMAGEIAAEFGHELLKTGGKATAEQLKETSLPVYDVRLLLMEPVDLMGYPYRDPEDNIMRWSTPSVLPPEYIKSSTFHIGPDGEKKYEMKRNDQPSILLLDELTSCAPAMQAAAFQLVLDRKCGEYRLPENCMIIAAGNRTSDRGVVNPLPTPLANRFVHFELAANAADWLNYAVGAGCHPAVVSFISEHKRNLFVFDPTGIDTDRAFPTPRSWMFVSDILWEIEKDTGTLHKNSLITSLVGGCVGSGMAVEFKAFVDNAKDLPSAKKILMGDYFNKTIPGLKKNISAQYYIASAICYEIEGYNSVLKKGKTLDSSSPAGEKYNNVVNNFFEFINNNLSKELAVVAVRAAVHRGMRMDHEECAEVDKFLENNHFH